MKKALILWLLFCVSAMVVLQAEEKRPYIVGTFLTGVGEHLKGTSLGTNVEWINGGRVPWTYLDSVEKDTTLSWPLIFDIKLISVFGAGFTFGDLYTISMNQNYQDANHLYFGFSYVYPISKWDIGASLIMFPVYIVDDTLIAGKFDVSYWFMKDIGVSMSTTLGRTTGWANVNVTLFNVLAGISLKI